MLRKKLLSVLLVLLFSFSVGFALDASAESKAIQAQEITLSNQSQNQTNSLNKFNSETNSLSQNSNQQSSQSQTQMQPQKSAREYLESARLELEALKIALTESNSGLESMKTQLNNCLENLENCEKALQSNKEDTSVAIEELGNIFSEYQKYKELAANAENRLRRAYVTGNIMIPAISLPLIITGSVLMATNNDYGKPVLYSGLGALIGCELIWNGGHLIFKVW